MSGPSATRDHARRDPASRVVVSAASHHIERSAEARASPCTSPTMIVHAPGLPHLSSRRAWRASGIARSEAAFARKNRFLSASTVKPTSTPAGTSMPSLYLSVVCSAVAMAADADVLVKGCSSRSRRRSSRQPTLRTTPGIRPPEMMHPWTTSGRSRYRRVRLVTKTNLRGRVMRVTADRPAIVAEVEERVDGAESTRLPRRLDTPDVAPVADRAIVLARHSVRGEVVRVDLLSSATMHGKDRREPGSCLLCSTRRRD